MCTLGFREGWRTRRKFCSTIVEQCWFALKLSRASSYFPKHGRDLLCICYKLWSMWNKVNFHVHVCFNRITNLRRVILLTDLGFIASADRRNKFVLDCSLLECFIGNCFWVSENFCLLLLSWFFVRCLFCWWRLIKLIVNRNLSDCRRYL